MKRTPVSMFGCLVQTAYVIVALCAAARIGFGQSGFVGGFRVDAEVVTGERHGFRGRAAPVHDAADVDSLEQVGRLGRGGISEDAGLPLGG